MNEEKLIEERFSKEMPFKVPENYFEDFTAQMMSQLPERKPKQSRQRPYMWVAACFCAVALGIGAYLHFNQKVVSPANSSSAGQLAAEVGHEGDLLDQAADYMMYDDHDFYAYLSEE
ncbi:MAG: hypothetical protein J6E45_01015 [Prevotella sp.]|nr:hypothetical protein [Prevotella sp.]